MIKAVIFDLDNTLLDFIKMKREAVQNALLSMKEAGLELDIDKSYEEVMSIYETEGWEHQLVFNKFLNDKIGYVDNKYLAAAIVAYRRGKEANLKAYPNVHRTLNHLMKSGIKLAIVSDAPSREAWMRIYYLNLHHTFDAVVTFDDSKERKPSPKPFNLVMIASEINFLEFLFLSLITITLLLCVWCISNSFFLSIFIFFETRAKFLLTVFWLSFDPFPQFKL